MPKRNNRKLTTETWIEAAREVHGDAYDYALVEFKKMITPVTIICPEHGEFQQQPRHHLNGCKCPGCAGRPVVSTDEFVRWAKEIHGDKYDYAETHYKSRQSKVVVSCPEHGRFNQTPATHLRGVGCPMCAQDSRKVRLTLTHEDFVTRAIAVHGFVYTYPTPYAGSTTPVGIRCPAHGLFNQSPNSHLSGSGCPSCSNVGPSGPEKAIREVVDEANPNLTWTYNRRDIIPPQEIDLYCAEAKLGIEFNGSYWHSEKFKTDKTSHQKKTLKAWSEGLQLLHIWEHEWKDESMRTKWTAVLNRRLGKTTCVDAGKLEVRPVDPNIGSFLLDLWDLQGGVGASSWLSLWDDQDRVLAVMALARPRKGAEDWELLRYCERPGFSLEGGMQKLFDHWRPAHPGSVLSYTPLDLAGPEKCPLEELGFSLAGLTSPDYVWINGRRCVTRYQASSSKIQSVLPEADLELTEVERMQALGFSRAYNSGRAKFVLPAGPTPTTSPAAP